MKKFWANNEDLSAEEQRLATRLYEAHAKCVPRENCSTAALIQAGGGSRSLIQGYIGALATLGETHGPIREAYDVLVSPSVVAAAEGETRYVVFPQIVPGWGNSFIRGRIDDAFLPVDQTIESLWPRHHNRLREITGLLHARGKKIFPNPAAYTATVALILGMPRHLAPMLFVQARLEAWADIFNRVMTMKPEQKERAA